MALTLRVNRNKNKHRDGTEAGAGEVVDALMGTIEGLVAPISSLSRVRRQMRRRNTVRAQLLRNLHYQTLAARHQSTSKD